MDEFVKPDWVSTKGLEYCSRIMRVAAEELIQPSRMYTAEQSRRSLAVMEFLESAATEILKASKNSWEDASRTSLANISICLHRAWQAGGVVMGNRQACKRLAEISCKIMAANGGYITDWEFPRRVVVQTLRDNRDLRAEIRQDMRCVRIHRGVALAVERAEREAAGNVIFEIVPGANRSAARRVAARGYELEWKY